MMEKEKIFYHAVAIALEGDPSSMRRVRKRCGDIPKPWETIYNELPNPPNPDEAWERLEQSGVQFIFADDEAFPPCLREIYHPPLGLYIRGELSSLKSIGYADSISIVGTRRATPEGKATTKRFARELTLAGFGIISGLALGIDAAAHEGCLEADGRTAAVLAGGLDKFYPTTNEKLGKQILENDGVVISEYPPGEPPYGYRFLERNRIVSGFSSGVLVIECPERSGSLATAAYAAQQNRNLFVIPGPISHPNFFGSHQLIRQGAELVTSPEDILETYGMVNNTREKKFEREIASTSNEEKQVLLALREISAAADVDKIAEVAKLEPRTANQALTFLIMKGLVKETAVGYIIE
jgi:DNA processing protein